MAVTYVDSSALVKLVAEEPESAALRQHLRRRGIASSALARTELYRAIMHGGEEAIAKGRALLLRVDLIRVSDRVLTSAGTLLPPELRSLDAIHLATALQLGRDITHFITYDIRMRDAASQLGLRTVTPS